MNVTGELTSVAVDREARLSPSSPAPFSPQHHASPAPVKPHVNDNPDESWTKSGIGAFPSWFERLLPQHFAPPPGTMSAVHV
jgi:hypothetical protein